VIELKSGTRIWIAAGFTDLRRGFQGLSSIVETVLEQAPFSGHAFVFRGKRGDLIKAVVVRWRWPVSFSEETRARTLHLASGNERNGVIDACAAIDAFGRHRLASAAEDMGTTVGRIGALVLIYNCDVTMAYSVPWLMRMPLLLI
jgi:hypothetical protein